MREERLKMALRKVFLRITWIWTTGLRLEGSVPPLVPPPNFTYAFWSSVEPRFLEFSSLAYCRVFSIVDFFYIKFFGNFDTNLFISSLSSWWSKIVAFWSSKIPMMSNRWQFLCVPTRQVPPPRALKRSSWEKRAAGLFFNVAAEHVYTTSFVWQFSSSGNFLRLAISLGSWQARPVATSVARQKDKKG